MNLPPALPPERLGEYVVIRALSPGSFLCLATNGRQVVLKTLESDCLLRGQLHPNIKERLLRVREIAQKHVATLQTVERVDGNAYLVWDHVDGRTFDDYTADPATTPRQLSMLAREVILSIESLHSQGIVHGSLHGRNIIIDSSSRVFITHVSPLLYNDPAEDTAAVVDLLKEMINRRSAQATPLGKVLQDIESRAFTLRQLAGRLALISNAVVDAPTARDDQSAAGLRRRAVIGAAAAVLVGIAIAAAVYFTFARRSSPANRPFEPLDTVSSVK